MGLINFLRISTKFLLSRSFWIICRPSVTLLCPLYASIRAIESDKASRYEKCLQYWVLFGLTTFLELTLAKPLAGFSFWRCAKGLASLLLVIYQFGAASYAYKHFVKPWVSPNLCIEKVAEKNDCMSMNCSDYVDTATPHVEQVKKDHQQSFFIDEVESAPTYDQPFYIYPKKVQKDWSCALCLVSTSSEKCLKQHIRGRKHKLKEKEERKTEMMASKEAKFASKLERNYVRDLFKSLNQLKSAKFVDLRGFNFPIKRPVKCCTWNKPQYGWIKLNTDGSVDRKSSGLGCLLRDAEGVPICACISKVSCDNIFLVELLAIWRGLTLALNMGIEMIWVESDSMGAVKAINKEQPYSQKASSCLNLIWKILKKFQKYQVTHSWRETNRAADYLSKMDVSGSDIVIWPIEFPSSLCQIIAEDAQGSWYLRW